MAARYERRRKRKKIVNSLIIFTKTPVAGSVKTRLATSVGDEKAKDIYIKLVNHTLRVATAIPAKRFIFNYPHQQLKEESLNYDPEYYEHHIQTGADLGERMSGAIEKVSRHSLKTVLVGSDCSRLMPFHVLKAFDALNKSDIVFGPAEDGGYYLVGMKRHHAGIFLDMEWSHPEVLKESIKRCHSHKLTYRLINQLSDIDEPKDWLAWKI